MRTGGTIPRSSTGTAIAAMARARTVRRVGICMIDDSIEFLLVGSVPRENVIRRSRTMTTSMMLLLQLQGAVRPRGAHFFIEPNLVELPQEAKLRQLQRLS